METQLQSSQQTKSAEIAASIDYLLTEILLRLPIKSVIRFKLVSKHWFHLISDPSFCQLLNPNRNPAVGLFLQLSTANFGEDHQYNGYEFVPFHPNKSTEFIKDHLPSGVRILQSCNGLMLCCSLITANNGPEYFVYNPTTKKLSILPKPDQTNGISETIRGINLAFEPVKAFHYKIVSVRSLESDSSFKIIVYSSETHSWQEQSHPFTSAASFDKGVYWNGAIHWMDTVGNAESLYFNVATKALRNTPSLPLTYTTRCKRDNYFGESCDHLHFIDMRGPRVKLVVYELERDYSGWFMKYQVDLSAVVVANPTMALRRGNPMFWCGFVFEVSAVIRGEEDEDSFLVLQIPGKMVRFNIVHKTFEDLVDFDGRVVWSSLKFPNVGGFQYIQSICCV
ncbi:F-box protein-like [Dorcoceras hygrometricum]|uniref:F-box protein-like n=1 Tax=Dorcoceras hygrometricum TaxID=472368 RepID=A0A2Z7A4R1_9LAMI|nr:F-box protein-like [Dorcoceras hygrometricum]